MHKYLCVKATHCGFTRLLCQTIVRVQDVTVLWQKPPRAGSPLPVFTRLTKLAAGGRFVFIVQTDGEVVNERIF